MIVFGPVPSRRLGRSLGVNHIPFKHCTYSCTYCQLGATPRTEIERRPFLATERILTAVRRKLEELRRDGGEVDIVTLVPDGEPTLDRRLGRHVRALRTLGLPVAVITNGSLLHLPEVREELASADVVSLKVDTTRNKTWRRLNRPHPSLRMDTFISGIRDFAGGYSGELLTETMLVSGINDSERAVAEVTAFLASIRPSRVCLAVPVRPPADAGVRPPASEALLRACRMMRQALPSVELLVSGEEGAFGTTGDAAEDLLAILAVHPMREESARRYLADAGVSWELVERLLREGRIARLEFLGRTFLARRSAGTPGAADPRRS
jgi:wyosine [tRNA(Phe)-imidazoG37] synthetase (radical SAM superfamily)